jgi:uncharacterized protein YjiS (DUF1127 family)
MILKGKPMFASLHTSSLAVNRLQPRGSFAGFTRRLGLALAAKRQRAQLAQLDATLLADIGITCRQAQSEAARSAWDVPSTWLR